MRKWAITSRPQKVYRYLLGREWEKGPTICFIMLNPSMADHRQNDRTLSRCIQFARDEGFGKLLLVNLFALRSPYPRDLGAARTAGRNPVGKRNDKHVVAAASEAEKVVAAWGHYGALEGRSRQVVQLLAKAGIRKLWCLGTTVAGHPKHPLRLPRGEKMIVWKTKDQE